jgi:acetyltransferase-like isoleucine patch superfamily enzyme
MRLPRSVTRRVGDVVLQAQESLTNWASVAADSRRAARFGAFGTGSLLRYPLGAVYNERYIRIGSGTLIGPDVALAAGMLPGQTMVTDPVISIGDRCLIGRGSGIVGHLSIEIGDDVYTGHYVYITDQNHGYDRTDVPISRQSQPERPVVIGSGSWIGHGAVVLPGARIGVGCVIGANSVVSGTIPDHSIAVGAPARVVRTIGST